MISGIPFTVDVDYLESEYRQMPAFYNYLRPFQTSNRSQWAP